MGRARVPALPLHPSSSDPPEPRGEARGQSIWEKPSRSKGTTRVLRQSLGGTLGQRAPGVAGGLSAPPRVQKPVGQEGRGRPPVGQLRRGGLGGRMLVYLR